MPVGDVEVDEGVRRGGTLETLGQIKPAYSEGGKITAGNASQISDGGGALLMTISETAKELGLEPIARIYTAVLAAEDPVIMLTAPIPATKKALDRAGLTIDVPLAWLAETGADPARLNPSGGAIALGHPIGGSGARLMTTMVHHMRQNGVRYGLQSMCEGGGMANATIVERVAA